MNLLFKAILSLMVMFNIPPILAFPAPTDTSQPSSPPPLPLSLPSSPSSLPSLPSWHSSPLSPALAVASSASCDAPDINEDERDPELSSIALNNLHSQIYPGSIQIHPGIFMSSSIIPSRRQTGRRHERIAISHNYEEEKQPELIPVTHRASSISPWNYTPSISPARPNQGRITPVSSTVLTFSRSSSASGFNRSEFSPSNFRSATPVSAAPQPQHVRTVNAAALRVDTRPAHTPAPFNSPVGQQPSAGNIPSLDLNDDN
ncbi:MAG: hypothetical protein P4L31_08420 [Candidatus Babeliales bacterium]|nr:hypothetical protein [Candidatus Babeliales bacterium]